MFCKLFSFSAVVLFLGQWLFSQNQSGVGVSGSYVMQPSAPVQITRLTKTPQDLLAAVTVTNKSEKTVTSLRLGWTVGIPQPCSATATAPAITRQMAMVDRIELSPNESATTKDYRLLTADLVAKAKQQNAVLIDFQVAVMEVTFGDGSIWNAALPENTMFDAVSFEFQGNLCSGGELKPQAVQGPCNPSSGSSATSVNLSTLSSSGPLLGCHFACTANEAPVFCTNNDTSCTESGCSNPNSCAHQLCILLGC